MKNTFKLFGIIALAVVIGFLMTACDFFDRSDDDPPYTPSGGFNPEEHGYTKGWPPEHRLSWYGLSSMPQPEGASNFYYAESLRINYSNDGDILSILFIPSDSSRSSVNNWLTSHGWSLLGSNEEVMIWDKKPHLQSQYNPADRGYHQFVVIYDYGFPLD
jgi:hypothetical protein